MNFTHKKLKKIWKNREPFRYSVQRLQRNSYFNTVAFIHYLIFQRMKHILKILAKLFWKDSYSLYLGNTKSLCNSFIISIELNYILSQIYLLYSWINYALILYQRLYHTSLIINKQQKIEYHFFKKMSELCQRGYAL